MGAAVILPSILSVVGSLFTGLFNLKSQQASLASQVLQTVQTVAAQSGTEQAARASIIQAEAMSQSWLPRNIRPLILLILTALVVSFWFGFEPVNLNAPMGPMMIEIFDLLKIGFGGYIGGRTFEKVADIVMHWKALQTAIERKVL